jgi:addiction module HigA family antidote
MKQFIQHDPPHPGVILFDFYFEPLKLSITEAADRLQITRPNLSAIVNGKAGISAMMALKLSKAFDTTPQYWMNLQTAYDLWNAMKASEVEKIRPFKAALTASPSPATRLHEDAEVYERRSAPIKVHPQGGKPSATTAKKNVKRKSSK